MFDWMKKKIESKRDQDVKAEAQNIFDAAPDLITHQKMCADKEIEKEAKYNEEMKAYHEKVSAKELEYTKKYADLSVSIDEALEKLAADNSRQNRCNLLDLIKKYRRGNLYFPCDMEVFPNEPHSPGKYPYPKSILRQNRGELYTNALMALVAKCRYANNELSKACGVFCSNGFYLQNECFDGKNSEVVFAGESSVGRILKYVHTTIGSDGIERTSVSVIFIPAKSIK